MAISTRGNAGGLIGPNAIIQVANALGERFGSPMIERIFARAGLEPFAKAQPQHMVREDHVAALHRELSESLGMASAEAVLWEAGLRTADYLLANRIPKAVQWLLRRLPPRLASRLLLTAIGRHAWTFAGSGSFHAEAGMPVRIRIINDTLAFGSASAPSSSYFRAVFERLYRRLVAPGARAIADADGVRPGCSFLIVW